MSFPTARTPQYMLQGHKTCLTDSPLIVTINFVNLMGCSLQIILFSYLTFEHDILLLSVQIGDTRDNKCCEFYLLGDLYIFAYSRV